MILSLFAFCLAFGHTTGLYNVTGPITEDFESWLEENGYEDQNFARHELGTQGSYGGRERSNQTVNHIPIVFHHGNTDGALNSTGPYSSGSSAQIDYFLSKGYTSAELYVTTWGNRIVDEAQYQAHNCSTIKRLRKFVEAVMTYTKSEKIIIFSHSMGVTLARKLVKGGTVPGEGNCTVGSYMGDKVALFLGIAGANYGMCSCYYPAYTCNPQSGFYPGSSCGKIATQCPIKEQNCNSTDYSQILKDMNEDGVREGQHVVAFWTRIDDVISYQDMVFGVPSSRMPTMDKEYIFENYTHMQTKELTVDLQYQLVMNLTGEPPQNNYESSSYHYFTILFSYCCILLFIQ